MIKPPSRVRRLLLLAPVAAGFAFPHAAWAHASLSPPVVLAKTLQTFTLAVPTEKDGATTTEIQMTPPPGFAIDSFAPAPGWKRNVQQSGSGEGAVVQTVTWSGGHTPTEEDSIFQFVASTDAAKTYTFTVRQTYSDGSVVNWSGNESSDTPAPSIEAKSSLGSGNTLLSVIAIALAALAVVLGMVALVAGSGAGERFGVSVRARAAALLAVLAGSLALPASAWAHAVLEHTVPSATSVVDQSPPDVQLTYSEAVEPRFASVSVTNAAGRQQTDGAPARSPANADTLVTPLKHLAEGWYLVYWRVISVDGHPVRGAFTFAVGPNPGPSPQFVIPSISETAATPQLLAARWIVLLSAMAAVGLFVLRALIARPAVRRAPGTSLRAVTIAFGVAAAVGVVATPVYVDLATAQFSLRSAFDVGALVPLLGVSAFGHGYLELWLCFALFALAAWVSIWLDRPEREHRSVAELLALTGTLAAAAATLLIPGVSGHAGQTSPRGLAVPLDWLHLVSGALWVGGLIGLLALWAGQPAKRRVAALAVAVPRFSNVALGSVTLLICSGIGAALLRFPTLASLWNTSYGQALLVKIALLLLALMLAAVNLLSTRPRLLASAARPELGAPAAAQLRRLLAGEAVLVAGAVFAAAVLTSLAPPPKAVASVKPLADVGPGPVNRTLTRAGYQLAVGVAPNRAAVPNTFKARLTRDGKPVSGATVTETFTMLDMEMGQQAFKLRETSPGVYSVATPALVMVGHWGLQFDVQPPGKPPFTVTVVDRASG